MIFFKTHYKELYNYIEDSQLYEKFISNKINNHTILLTFVNLKSESWNWWKKRGNIPKYSYPHSMVVYMIKYLNLNK